MNNPQNRRDSQITPIQAGNIGQDKAPAGKPLPKPQQQPQPSKVAPGAEGKIVAPGTGDRPARRS